MTRSADLILSDYKSDRPQPHHRYQDAQVIRLIESAVTRVFDLGCGNGFFTQKLARLVISIRLAKSGRSDFGRRAH